MRATKKRNKQSMPRVRMCGANEWEAVQWLDGGRYRRVVAFGPASVAFPILRMRLEEARKAFG